MLKINTWRDPYDAGFSTTRAREVVFEEGLTILVGCNGSGKTTLLRNIKEECRKNGIPFLSHDNMKDGGDRALSFAAFTGNMGQVASLFTASEGEAIKMNLGSILGRARKFLETGKGDGYDEATESKARVFLLDAVDSGLSVDSIVEVRNVFDLIFKDAKEMGVEAYIIASANEYELARHAPCFEVSSGRYVDIENYEDYRSFILNSRTKKDRRDKRASEVMEKREKERVESVGKRSREIAQDKRRERSEQKSEGAANESKEDAASGKTRTLHTSFETSWVGSGMGISFDEEEYGDDSFGRNEMW